MAIFEVFGGRITARYLERKYTKAELSREYMRLLDRLERLEHALQIGEDGMPDGVLPPTEREAKALNERDALREEVADLRLFVETIEDMTEIRCKTPLPKAITDEATRILDRLYPRRIKT